MTETVTCSGCLLQIDPNDSTRTWANGRWFFFCRTCEHDGTRLDVLRRLNNDHKNESGAALLQQ